MAVTASLQTTCALPAAGERKWPGEIRMPGYRAEAVSVGGFHAFGRRANVCSDVHTPAPGAWWWANANPRRKFYRDSPESFRHIFTDCEVRVTPTCCIRGFRRYTAKLSRSDSERKIQACSQNRSVSHAKRGQPRHCRDCLVLCRWDVMETSALGTWRAESCRSRGHAAQHPPRKHDRAPACNGTRLDTAGNEMARRARYPPPPVC